ncbi:unnamed protein product [Protopolystoma xenopodis]|uniref:Uncharacterized protein n=1 Tax=Protopolystoma xenopodis TaxID=117903 RepID=A0A448WEP5_9PLAT|nr:unnamed protein product [Protopolystoma xenopodis]
MDPCRAVVRYMTSIAGLQPATPYSYGDSRPALRVLYTIYSHYRYYDGGTGSGLSDDPLDPTFSEAEMATSPPEILPNSSASEAQQSPTLGDHQHLRTGGITESIYSN